MGVQKLTSTLLFDILIDLLGLHSTTSNLYIFSSNLKDIIPNTVKQK